MIVLAIDPGTHESGWCLFDGAVRDSGVTPNAELLATVRKDQSDILAIEAFKARGNVIDNNCVQTIRWEGRFMEAWGDPDGVLLVSRQAVKVALGLPGSADDARVNARVRQMLGDKGTKKAPGPLYGIKSHAWAALAVAITAIRE